MGLPPVKLVVRRSGREKGVNYTTSSSVIQRILPDGTTMDIADSIIYMRFGFSTNIIICRGRNYVFEKVYVITVVQVDLFYHHYNGMLL